MTNNTHLSKKLSLSTESLRVLSGEELGDVVGGAGNSAMSVCVGNGKTNDTHSALGNCHTNQGDR